MIMEFKSQICTSRSQSEKLLALGIKKETADMVHQAIGTTPYNVWDKQEIKDDFYPAWSLHRLIEILPFEPCLKDFNTEFQYDAMLIHIANAIESNNINPEYLEEKK